MIFDRMAVICLDFKWLGFQISDPIWNRTIWNLTSIGPFKIQTSPDFRSALYTQGLFYGTLRVEFTCTGHCPNRCMSWRGNFVTSSFGFRCGGGEEALELEGVMSPEARSLCEGLEARLMSSDSAVLGHSCQPLPANSRSWDMLLLPILPKGRPVNND